MDEERSTWVCIHSMTHAPPQGTVKGTSTMDEGAVDVGLRP